MGEGLRLKEWGKHTPAGLWISRTLTTLQHNVQVPHERSGNTLACHFAIKASLADASRSGSALISPAAYNEAPAVRGKGCCRRSSHAVDWKPRGKSADLQFLVI